MGEGWRRHLSSIDVRRLACMSTPTRRRSKKKQPPKWLLDTGICAAEAGDDADGEVPETTGEEAVAEYTYEFNYQHKETRSVKCARARVVHARIGSGTIGVEGTMLEA
eukprot:3118998-Pyramimonas_sp.AAC.1